MKKILSLIMIMTILFMMAGCGGTKKTESTETSNKTEDTPTNSPSAKPTDEPKNDHYPVTIKTFDYAKNHVEMVFDKAPEKVIVDSANSLENMLALGLDDKIIGGQFLSKAKLDPDFYDRIDKLLNIREDGFTKEQVLTMQPDFILAWYGSFRDKYLGDIYFWNERGINTYMAYNSDLTYKVDKLSDDDDYIPSDPLEKEYLDILNLGKIFDVEDRAEKIIAEIKQKIADGKQYAEQSDEKKTVLIIEAGGNCSNISTFNVYGDQTIAGALASQLGADVMLKGPKDQLSAEKVIELNPDYLFVYYWNNTTWTSETCLDMFDLNPAWKNMDAYKNGKVIPVSASYVHCPGVRILKAVDFFIDNLYKN